MLSVSHEPTETTQRCPGATDDRGSRRGHLRPNEFKWSHNPFFANKPRPDGDRDTQMVSNDLVRRAASDDMHIDLLGWICRKGVFLLGMMSLTWHLPTRGRVLKLTFQGKKVHFPNRLDKANTMVSFLFSYLSYQKVINEDQLREKPEFCHLMISLAKTLDQIVKNG